MGESRQDHRELAGRTLVVGIPGPRLDEAVVRELEELGPAGVILFARNIEDATQLHRLCLDLHEVIDDPLILLDQEGGQVDRLKPLLGATTAARPLAARGVSAVRRQAEATAKALRLLGFGFNCAPVVDLDEGHEANGIADRSYGADSSFVAAMAAAVLEAHAEAGVIACLKHFPGLGRTDGDTHQVRPVVQASLEELTARELAPFEQLAARAPAIMVCHASFPAIDGGGLPATLSQAVVSGLLRERLGYEGLVVTDDLEMGGVTDRPAAERATGALSAGCDLLLFCHRFDEARSGRDAIVAALRDGAVRDGAVRDGAVRDGALTEESLRESVGRIDRLRRSVGAPSAVLDEEALGAITVELGGSVA